MKAIMVLMYTLKVNILQILVRNSQNHSISLNYIDSSLFEASASTRCPDEYADLSFVNNITEVPFV
ncbi:uncharacterized protein CANTADRAFT_59492 [Suhomyces tanzawaensis NRRL Y-17324]|uniref:Uncharacterized protein n=1 Tax=Suhomyces tanzawaensis NRRL Y-17324 TaxID=984487 RepID=A0A1E4SQV5_9ASCO|nr:uncharacterized protein CANTADRAFT_59492 [Suhomyces tanzawaensis NRRL Y-17324]ODV81884.1 hypothetical protein CANTADRAFT_59492 [Suhomyces tanzawaensis NRRL Y-17324]